MGLVPRWEGGAGRGQVPEFLLGDHVGGQGLEPGAGEGDLAGDAAPVVREKDEGCVAEGGGRLVPEVGEGEDEGGVGWKRQSGGGTQGVAQGMAETGTAPGSTMPSKPTTQRTAVSGVHTGGALWGEVQEK